MFQKIFDSWALVKASAAVLRMDKEMLALPTMSFLASALIAISFALPVFASKEIFLNGQNSSLLWALSFLFYFMQYFVIFFFNAALVRAAQMRFQGLDPTLADALAAARDVVIPLLGYAAIAATVGMILRAIQERAGFLGKIAAGLAGIGWTLATFLVVPVLVQRHMGPIEAISESTRLLKKTWGENIAGTIGLNIIFGIATFIGVLLFIGPALFMVKTSMMMALAMALLGVIVFLGLAIYQTALTAIYQAAVYRYADTGEIPAGFEDGMIEHAFTQK